MITVRPASVGLGLLATVAVLLSAGCDPAKTADSAPRDTLLAAVADLSTTSYAVQLRSGARTAVGTIDPAARTAMLASTDSVRGARLRVTALLVSPDVWVRLDGPASQPAGTDPKRWLKVDPTRVTSRAALPLDTSNWADPLDVRGLLTGAVPRRVDATHYAGTIDLTRATGRNAPDPLEMTGIGAGATAVPFTATVDPQGRFTDIRIEDGTLVFDLRFSDYGTAPPVSRPDESQVAATSAKVYAVLNGD